jgi:hydrogenase maturation protein HypF
LLRVAADQAEVEALVGRIERGLPPLARIDGFESRRFDGVLPARFRIAESTGGGANTEVAPDAAICGACAAELRSPTERRYRYPFTNCTHCGPRLTIVRAIPYDRAATTMAQFALCAACAAEYRDPRDRRFHAEPIACPACGPQARLVALAGAAAPHRAAMNDAAMDDVERAAELIRNGAIVAIKGLGGYHLACDAGNAAAVAELRRRKRRDRKPFALMARDLAVIRHYCAVDAEEERHLISAAAPIVLLRAGGEARLPEAIAPGLNTLGFMLPTTPLHLLLMQDLSIPLVMTSGNVSDEPAIIDDARALRVLGGIADHALVHDRVIASRVDDSVVRVMDGKARTLRRARGFAPAPIKLPAGFPSCAALLALGGELKSTFCLVKNRSAVLSQHQGDLENAATFDDYCNNLALYQELFEHAPAAIVVDCHPDYLSSKWGRGEARRLGVPLLEVQHHHAHVAACLTENARPLNAPAVLGIVLDGLGYGDDGAIWGGEFLVADYYGYRRLARLKPLPMPGGAQAVREPWRNLYAHLAAAIGWPNLCAPDPDFALCRYLRGKPLAQIDAMIARGINAPPASSCGRLFDAVAAALGVCRDRQAYEGEAAACLEALAAVPSEPVKPYRFAIAPADGLMEIDPAPMWIDLVHDLAQATPAAIMARRFHQGLAAAVAAMTRRLGLAARFDTVALSGGCFQNRILFEAIAQLLRAAGFRVLSHAEVPANDGGLALGQAAIGLAQLAGRPTHTSQHIME